MEPITIILGVLVVGSAAAAVWLAVRLSAQRTEGAVARTEAAERLDYIRRQEGAWDDREKEVIALKERLALAKAELEHAEKLGAERLASAQREKAAIESSLAGLKAQAAETFKSLASDALAMSNKQFLTLAETKLGQQQQAGAADLEKRRLAVEQMVRPIAETLAKTDAKLGQIEKERAESFGKLTAELAGLGRAGEQLRDETGKLVRALREPHVRGRYGELQLKRVAELAGMSAYCDFTEQDQSADSEGNPLKPDMIVRMPSDRVVVVDAKTNIKAYLEALEARTPEDAEGCLDRFARHVGEQATALARKKYWTQYDGSPEFVVMFIPGDQFIDAALSRQPEILEKAAMQNVLLAGPATLIGLLRAVAVGYKEQRLAEAAMELRELGVKLHGQMATALDHLDDLGGALNKAVEKFNGFVGSYQSRLEPTLKKFEDAGVKGPKELPEIPPIDVQTRTLKGSRLTGGFADAASP